MEYRATEIRETFFVKLVKIGMVLLFTALPFATLVGQDEEDEAEEREARRVHYTAAFPHSRWTVRFYGLELESEPEDHRADPFEEDAFGLGGNMEFRLTRRWGIEADLLAAGHGGYHCRRCRDDHSRDYHDDEWDGRGYAGLLVGMNFHLTPSSLIDLHFGPTLGFMIYEDETWDHFTEEDRYHDYDHEDDVEGSAVVGLNLGIDIPFGPRKRWLFYASVKSMGAVWDGDNYYRRDDRLVSRDRDWDVAALGFGYKF